MFEKEFVEEEIALLELEIEHYEEMFNTVAKTKKDKKELSDLITENQKKIEKLRRSLSS